MLKFRYASYLLLVLIVLALCAVAIVIFLEKKMYLPVVMIFALLYPSSYFLGRKLQSN